MAKKTATAPRKQPKQARAQETVEAILTAAARILKKEGFDKASTNRIAEVAGVSIGSLYQYFPSKEALVAALYERHMNEMSEVIAEAGARILMEPLQVAVREVVELMLRAHAVDPELHRVLMEGIPRSAIVSTANDVEQKATAIARAYLEVHKKEIRPKNLDLAASIVVGTIESLTHGAVLHRPSLLSGGELAEEITELVVRYLKRNEFRVVPAESA
jgi:AcrR family transcriptional regulator